MFDTILVFLRTIRGLGGALMILLTAASFHLNGRPISEAVLPALNVFVIYSETIMISDYYDRFRDAFAALIFFRNDCKRSDHLLFATRHQRTVQMCALILGIISILSSLAFMRINAAWMIIFLVMSVLAFTYPLTVKIPVLSTIVVGLTSAMVALLGSSNGISTASIMFGSAVFFAMAGREEEKNILDWRQDSHRKYGKYTIPVIFGTDTAVVVAKGCQVVSGLIILAMPIPTVSKILPGLVVTLIGLSAFKLSEKNLDKAKSMFDSAIALFLLGLCFGINLPHMPATIGGITIQQKPEGEVRVKMSQVRINRTVWAVMYLLFGLTIFSLRVIFSHNWLDSLMLAILAMAALYLMRFMPVNNDYDRLPAHIRVKRMIIGMTIGLIAVGLNCLGIPYLITAVALPIYVICSSIRGELCILLKDHATQLGIVLIVAITLGPTHALIGFFLASIPVMSLYHYKAIKLGIPVWKPAFLC